MKYRKTRSEIFAGAILLAMLTVGSDAVTINSEVADLYGNRSNRGRIALASTGPVVSLGSSTGVFKYYVSTNLGASWASRSGAWVTGGSTSSDLMVDSNDNYHLVYSGSGKSVTHVEHTGNRQTISGTNVWSDGGGNVQIVETSDGISIGFSPRMSASSEDGWLGEYAYVTKSGGTWSDISRTDTPSNMMSPKFLASADDHWSFSLPRNNGSDPGPYWEQADDGVVGNYASLSTGLTSGNKAWGWHYDSYLSPAWNGSKMNLASIEGPGVGPVSLYLDVQGTTSQTVLFDDSATSSTGSNTARSVALASLGGTNYVFFIAEDAGAGTDSEVFAQAVAQDGSLIGSAVQLTNDDYPQFELDIAGGDDAMHLVYGYNIGGGDVGNRVGYMELVPEPASLGLLLLGAGLLRRRMKK